MQLYSNNYKNVIIKTLLAEAERVFPKKDTGKEEIIFKRTEKISSSGNIAKIFSKTQISLQRHEIQF